VAPGEPRNAPGRVEAHPVGLGTLRVARAHGFEENSHIPAFGKPGFPYSWDVDEELKALRDYPRQPGKARPGDPGQAGEPAAAGDLENRQTRRGRIGARDS
jgi:hypothetical protein